MIPRIITALGVIIFGATTALSPALAAPSHAAVTLLGAGSTFDFPFFDKAFSVYGPKHNVTVNYQPVGSGAGIQQFTAKTVNFGATDVPMNPVSELPAAVKAGGPVEQIPIALGGVAMAYNLPGIKSGLKLNGNVIARIYMGLITHWNDKAITSLNPRLKLPNTQITVAHRADSSGTSYIFTDYLAKVNDTWRGNVGVNKLPNWPVGVGGKGNPGVAAIVEQTPGAIGYVELAYVLQNHMTEAQVQNAAHQYEYPTLKTVATAAASFKKVSASNFSIVNSRAKGAYPICGYSWVLVYQHQTDTAKGKALVNLMHWTVTSGQSYAKALDYVPLPKNIQSIGTSDLAKVKM